MKTLKYILTGIILFVIISSCNSQTSEKYEQVITLQSVTKTNSKKLLSQSGEILLKRLAYLNLTNIQIIQNDAIPGLVITYQDTINRSTLSDVLLIQGHVSFYETITRQEVLKYFGKRSSDCIQKAFSLLHVNDSMRLGSEPVLGFAHAKDTMAINNCLSSKDIRNILPKHVKLLWTSYPGDKDQYFLYCISTLEKSFNEESIVEAHVDLTNPEHPALGISFKENVWESWRSATTRNMDKPVALVIDSKVCFAPVIRSEIPHGKISLTGRGISESEVRKLAAIISNGKLPLKFIVVGN
jgi:preprotein translocase subunit SecD